MLIVFLLSQNLVGDRQIVRRFAAACGLAPGGHLRAHPLHAEPDQFMRTMSPAECDAGFGIAGTARGICRFSLVDAIANRIIIAAAYDYRRGVSAAAAN
jgi:hypothetical protein